MGWWETEDGELVGDGVLDISQSMLAEISAEYLSEQSRLPTLRELVRCLEIAFDVSNYGDEPLFAEGKTHRVTRITAKLAKKPKTQPLKPGDLFVFASPENQFFVGRLTPQSGVIDFCDHAFLCAPKKEDVQQFSFFRLWSSVSDEFLRNKKWRVFANWPYETAEYELRHYRMGNYVTCGFEVEEDSFIDVGTLLRPAEPRDRELPLYSLASPEVAERLVMRKVLEGIPDRPMYR